MRHTLHGLVAAAALMIAGSAQAGFILTTDFVTPIPTDNDFKSDLNGLGLDVFTQGLSQALDISSPGKIEFFFEGKEAGYTNSFKSLIAGIDFMRSANDLTWNDMSQSIGMGNFNPGDIMGDWLFDSVQGVDDASVATNAFGIFYARADFAGMGSGPVDIGDVVYLGFDDQNTNQDGDHDDLVIKALFTPTPVPEPMTLGLMGLGLAGLGFFARRTNV